MGMGALKYWRLVIPGIMVLILILFIVQDSFSELTKAFSDFQLKDTIYTIVVVAIGAFYYVLHIRNLLWNPYRNRVNSNIKERLISSCGIQISEQQSAYLKDGRILMDVFYHFIDNDNSLLEKAKRVRFNGLIWTSVVDLTIIAVVGSLLFWIKYFIETNSYNLWMALILLILAIVSFGLIQLATKHHLSLSNEQLDIICSSYRPELENKVNEKLSNQR